MCIGHNFLGMQLDRKSEAKEIVLQIGSLNFVTVSAFNDKGIL